MAAQFTVTKGLSRRGLNWCIAREKTSFPVPLSPVRSTVASVGATRELARVENSGIVGKSSAKTVPLEIVECLDEIGKRVADLGLGAVRGDRMTDYRYGRYEDQNEYRSRFHRDAVYK